MKDKCTVATYSDVENALAAKLRLEQAGIPADVYDESKLQKFWFMSRSLAGRKVQVKRADWQLARIVLERSDPVSHVLHDEVRCPECRSVNVDYPQFTRKFITTTLAELGCLIGVIKKQFYCTDCHHSWGTEVKVPEKTDMLNWPVKKQTGSKLQQS